jgi:hypothetical protein
LNWFGVNSRLSQILHVSPEALFLLDGFEKRLEIALAEALAAAALDDLDEQGGSIFDGLGE